MLKKIVDLGHVGLNFGSVLGHFCVSSRLCWHNGGVRILHHVGEVVR